MVASQLNRQIIFLLKRPLKKKKKNTTEPPL